MKRSLVGTLAAALLLMLATAGTVFAQAQTGNLYGTVVDDKGALLPGVSITLTGGGAPQVQVTNAQGQFRFVNLSPGSYKVEAALEGFSTIVQESIPVDVGRNQEISVKMNAAIQETINVTSEGPLLDARKIQSGATVSKTELEKIPTARDPWVILQTTPGVLVDRVNVGGNESGQQSTYARGGAASTDSTWSVDGVEITDVGALGSSSSYYDFDAFEEINVNTGGSDATLRTGGVGINMVTKRGTNTWRGSGRYIYDDSSLQSSFNASKGDLAKSGPWNNGTATADHSQQIFKQGNRIDKVEDYGLELGGPVVKDRLWIWASYGKSDIKLKTISDFSDHTQLDTVNGKVNWQVAQNNTATFFYSNNDKKKQGRNASPTRPQETTWDQGFFGDHPTIWKIEDTHIFNANFFLTGLYDKNNGGFQLSPEGGVNSPVNAALDSGAVWHNTFLLYQSPRTQDQAKGDGSYFFNTGNLNHELKFGVSYRKATVGSLSRWPNYGIDYLGYGLAKVTRDANVKYEAKFTNGYLQDTMTTGNLTFNVGLRYDKQDGRNLPSTSRANQIFPDLLPASSYGGGSMGFDAWTNLSPRLGVTYALGAEKKTLLRASYSRFAQQLGNPYVNWLNPMGYPGAYLYYYATDLNGDGHFTQDEWQGFAFPNARYDPNNPANSLNSNAVDKNFKAPTTDEITLGVEHALMPEFVVGVTATYRILKNIAASDPLVFDGDPFSPENVGSTGRRATAADYTVATTLRGTLPNGETYAVPVYDLSGVNSRGGFFLYNSDVEQKYKEVALTFNKRLSHQWMVRGNFTWNDNKWSVPSNAFVDPTPAFGGGVAPFGTGSAFDGQSVLTCSGNGSGAKSNVCISSKWSYSMNGLYQVAPDKGWGFNLAAALNGRQGYADPYFRRLGAGSAGTAKTFGAPYFVDVTKNPDDVRNADIHILDLRIEKEFHFSQFGMTLGIDCFNALNSGAVLQRSLRLNRFVGVSATNRVAVGGDYVTEVVSPRIFRLGAKFSFN